MTRAELARSEAPRNAKRPTCPHLLRSLPAGREVRDRLNVDLSDIECSEERGSVTAAEAILELLFELIYERVRDRGVLSELHRELALTLGSRAEDVRVREHL